MNIDVPLRIKGYFILINLMLVSIIFEDTSLTLVLTILMTITILYEMIMVLKGKYLVNEISGWLIKKYLIISKKNIIASTFGFVFSLLILSQVLILISSYQGVIFQDALENDHSASISIVPNNINVKIEEINSTIDLFMSIGSSIFDKYGYSLDRINSEIFFTGSIHNPPAIESIKFGILRQEKLDFLLKNFIYIGSEPIDINKDSIGIFLVDSWSGINYTDFSNDIPLYDDINRETKYHNLTGSFYVPNDELEFFNGQSRNLELNIPMILEPDNRFWVDYSVYSFNQVDVPLVVNFFMNIPSISERTVNRLSDDLQKITFDIRETMFRNKPSGTAISPLKQIIDDNLSKIQNIKTMSLLAIAPVATLGLFLVYFTNDLIKDRKKKALSIFRQRGSSDLQLSSVLLSEITISGLTSILVGMILSIPWVILILATNGFLDFTNIVIAEPDIPINWYWRIPLIGLLLTLDLNLISIFKLSKIEIVEDTRNNSKEVPNWQKFHLDVVLFILGLIQYIFLNTNNLSLEERSNIGNYYLLIAPISLMALLIGSSLIVARYFSSSIGLLQKVFWYSRLNNIAIVIHNLKNNKFSHSRLCALLMMSAMISVGFLVVPHTVDGNLEDSEGYKIGSEIKINNLNPTTELMNNISSINGINTLSKVFTGYFDTSDGLRFIFIGINRSSFLNNAWWQSGYADKSLEELINNMDSNMSILMLKNQMKNLDRNEGDILSFLVQDSSYNFDIAGNFNLFPNLIDGKTNFEHSNNIYAIVMDYEIALNISYSLEINNAKHFIYGDLDKSIEVNSIREELEKILIPTSFPVEFLVEKVEEERNKPNYVLLQGIYQTMLIISLFIFVITLTYLLFITLERRSYEIGVFRSLGMVRNQIFKIFLFEAIAIIFVALITGSLMGFILAEYISSLTVFNSQIIPLRTYIPWSYIIQYLLLMLILGFILSYYLANKLSNRHVQSILRAD
ncbi:MAG: ABC transporter permease [Candidatus Hodarchaeales archaeon]|jgi:ABC-type antimicrobial peptide transport system permease subunit